MRNSLTIRSMAFVVSLMLIPVSAFPFTDESHFSTTFGIERFFRVFTPPGYDACDSVKRYPVIYYFHGCGGSYRSSGTYSYADHGLTAPVAMNRDYDPDYEYPNNADFENIAYHREVIIVCVDGKIADLPGCGVYFPSQSVSWNSGYYDFSTYIRELIEVVDSRYNTRRGPQYRAVSGLSMGGHTAVWVAAANPHLFSSASEFCHSPQYYDVGEPSYMTTIDVLQLWRNLRGLPFRHSTTDRDYLKYYTNQMYLTFSGAGFENEYYLADFCKHGAARADLQFDFHIKQFDSAKEAVACFSYMNLYPSFEIRGYDLSSLKKGNGWIYLRDVTRNGFGIYTRERLPWGKPLSNFDIAMTTPPVYVPNETYTVSRYSYRNNSFDSQHIIADSTGRLTIASSGGMGEEIGISGIELQPPVIVLVDTLNENIYLDHNTETALSFDVVNLSASDQTIDFTVSAEDSENLLITGGSRRVTVPPQSKISVDSLVVCKGIFLPLFKNTGYIRITSSINGIMMEKEHIIQVTVKDQVQYPDPSVIKIFDGRSEELLLFKYDWNQWNDPLSSGVISEGSGNGNGKAEMGETFSIWVNPPSAFDSLDTRTWHPTIPAMERGNNDIVVDKVTGHSFNTGRPLLSAQIRLNRKPEKNNPVRIQMQSEFLKVQPLVNDCHRNTADNFEYSYYEILLCEDGSVKISNQN
ncbi:MAG: alpha/beta hydrolase-fold protein [Bacteroidales bacterium]